MNERLHKQVDGIVALERLEALEKKVKRLEKQMEDAKSRDDVFRVEMDGLKSELVGLKAELLSAVSANGDRTWQMLNRQFKVILTLIMFILAIVGVKLYGM